MKTKVLLVGDTHGVFGPLNTLINQQRPDIIVQLGDLGYWPNVWPERLETINTQGADLLFCDGNHEDLESLYSKHPKTKDESVQLAKHIYWIPRGTIINLPVLGTTLFFGGANSIDKDWRTPGYDWFSNELPTYGDIDTYDYFRKLYAEHNQKVKTVVSHTAPNKFDFMKHFHGAEEDPTTQFLNKILEETKPENWYFGHWHGHFTGTCENTKYEGLNHSTSGGTWWKLLKG